MQTLIRFNFATPFKYPLLKDYVKTKYKHAEIAIKWAQPGFATTYSTDPTLYDVIRTYAGYTDNHLFIGENSDGDVAVEYKDQIAIVKKENGCDWKVTVGTINDMGIISDYGNNRKGSIVILGLFSYLLQDNELQEFYKKIDWSKDPQIQ